MLNLNSTQLSKDYANHYTIFSEGDSSLSQIEAFYKLNPKKDGIYLNFGCGNSKWAVETINKINNDGYKLYGYEPYAEIHKEDLNEFIITDKSILENMKFDGIFSHNVLEHLFDPIEVTSDLINLLKPNSLLIHSTPCYEYLYEFTRFHIFFFTGKSIDYIAKQMNVEYKFIPKNEMQHMENGVIFYKSS